MDQNHPLVELCAQSMHAELEGCPADASALFLRAWAACDDAFGACVASHYVARHQATPEETLRWNAEALAQADAVGDERVLSFYPSLYLNIGHSHELLGDLTNALRYYELAASRLSNVPDGRYGDIVRGGVAEGRRRIATATPSADSPSLHGTPADTLPSRPPPP